MHSIEVQILQLRALLDRVFAEYPQRYPDATPYTVFLPFKPFVHRWDRILELRKRRNSEAIKQLEILCRKLEDSIKSHLSTLEGVRKNRTI